ncbi:ABC transporter substrate-binding protein [Labrys sp. WJW]|uniref:ABC transporter substrate-binding protein n=1 Tax=Labrys sp. WJW TaxID=1737983 RepID=UPI0008322277|nr:ABC transporter substrate-binding protein [Labrys sp. WJW]OCC06023.1 ABC transporter substrate-binding protein [Labrys sp. WJW]
MTTRPASIAAGTLAAALALGLSFAAFAGEFDLSPEQPGRLRADKNEEAIKAIAKDAKFARDGKFVVAVNPGLPPIATYATDSKTPIGFDPDLSQLVADSLGKELVLETVAWADWPLGLSSGKYDAVITNVTVTEERKEKFDFSTYRRDILGLYVKSDSAITSVKEPKDIAGLKVITDAGTNQEKILLAWDKQNQAAGLKPVEVQYYDDDAVKTLALQSGRADITFSVNATQAFQSAQTGKTKLVGTISGGWPVTADIAVTTRKGGGLADAVTIAINGLIKDGKYAKTLARWNLSAEAIDKAETNPQGLPKS